ncbi:hypothetical protein PHYPSEUDO_009886 [Phytophthora pseudosyringae]|uniref:Uncharacterized protein n=1 Tax=Phytophthora pseudosyringae TaxID=221518 RepID=A0A8T1VEI5_9STRA|nr:hypothetical protein PHYPSEUDO_009886 [Phytophthora pseudosyringae]
MCCGRHHENAPRSTPASCAPHARAFGQCGAFSRRDWKAPATVDVRAPDLGARVQVADVADARLRSSRPGRPAPQRGARAKAEATGARSNRADERAYSSRWAARSLHGDRKSPAGPRAILYPSLA